MSVDLPFKKVSHGQLSGQTGVRLGNPAVDQYAPLGNAGETRAGLASAKVNPFDLPTFPALDHVGPGATAINDTPLTENTFRLNMQTAGRQIDYDAYAYQNTKAGLRGWRTGRPPRAPKNRMVANSEAVNSHKTIDTHRYKSVLSSAPRGDHAVDMEVMQRLKIMKDTMGDGQYGRAHGYEYDTNPATIASSRRTVTDGSITAIPKNDDIRVNTSRIAPIQVGLPNV